MQNTANKHLRLQSALLEWYKLNGRHFLPWRDKSLKNRAYCVLVSEIMLQQTQVKVVLERYYFQFLKKFPNLELLSQAKESEVLHAWQGLGYYTRARNLYKLAKFCTHHKLALPNSKEALQKLPGIGAYTAGAIACFGYDKSVSFVDANIKRILLRLFALETPTQKILENKAQEILNTKDPFNHNQALLDLGALICTQKSPKCNICPLNTMCKGKENWQSFTYKKPIRNCKKSLYFAICIKDSKIALIKSKENLYKGLYNPPQYRNKPARMPNFTLKHNYTKYNLTIHCYYTKHYNSKDIEFFTLEKLSKIPLSSLTLKILKEIQHK